MPTTIIPVYLNFIRLGILMLAIDVRFRFTNRKQGIPMLRAAYLAFAGIPFIPALPE